MIDAHANKTEAEIWTVFEEVARRCPIRGAILERDENFPPFDEIIEELETAKKLLKKPNRTEIAAV